MSNLAWHFTDGMKLRDGTPLEVREYRYERFVEMCLSGYHWSRDPLDALKYAPGFTLSRVRVDEIVQEDEDKGVSRVREVLEIHDVRDVILLWAADVAEHAVHRYYTGDSDAPQKAIDTVRKHVQGTATSEECADAANAAADAYAADAAAYTAAHAAAYAVVAANAAANAATNVAANAAAYAVVAANHNTAADAAHRRLLRIQLAKVFDAYHEEARDE